MIKVTEVTLDTRVLDEYIKSLDGDTDKAVSMLALDVEANAKMLAPIDTGALRSSINSRRITPGRWIVSDGVEYGIYQELSTHRMAAHPFMIPGVEKTAQRIADIFKRVLSR